MSWCRRARHGPRPRRWRRNQCRGQPNERGAPDCGHGQIHQQFRFLAGNQAASDDLEHHITPGAETHQMLQGNIPMQVTQPVLFKHLERTAPGSTVRSGVHHQPLQIWPGQASRRDQAANRGQHRDRPVLAVPVATATHQLRATVAAVRQRGLDARDNPDSHTTLPRRHFEGQKLGGARRRLPQTKHHPPSRPRPHEPSRPPSTADAWRGTSTDLRRDGPWPRMRDRSSGKQGSCPICEAGHCCPLPTSATHPRAPPTPGKHAVQPAEPRSTHRCVPDTPPPPALRRKPPTDDSAPEMCPGRTGSRTGAFRDQQPLLPTHCLQTIRDDGDRHGPEGVPKTATGAPFRPRQPR